MSTFEILYVFKHGKKTFSLEVEKPVKTIHPYRVGIRYWGDENPFTALKDNYLFDSRGVYCTNAEEALQAISDIVSAHDDKRVKLKIAGRNSTNLIRISVDDLSLARIEEILNADRAGDMNYSYVYRKR